MEFYNSYLYALICKKADFAMLRKAEQVIALCEVEYCLESDCVGQAVSRYEAWQKAFPEGIESDKIPITLQEVCRISDAEFCCMPWIYANVLQDLCAGDEPEEGEITAKTELDYIARFSNATWIWGCDESYQSFEHAYTKFMKAEWINEFLDKMDVPWPLTPYWTASEVKGETIWPAQGYIVVTPKFKPLLPASPALSAIAAREPFLEQSISEVSTVIEEPSSNLVSEPAPTPAPVKTGPPKVRDEGFWPFMRCKNVYKAYGGKGRLSHHDLLVWLGKKFNMPVETLKKTNPYTIKDIKGVPNLKWGYY
jgi:hypothetical protein